MLEVFQMAPAKRRPDDLLARWRRHRIGHDRGRLAQSRGGYLSFRGLRGMLV